MQYMVSYKRMGWSRKCGNRCGTMEEVKKHTEENKHEWESYGFHQILPSNNGIHDLKTVDKALFE